MDAIRQKCRPKHQVLVLKCYPKLQKGILDVKPNSSELNYLLYYASTRRSKVQKVAEFLEKRTASDVWKGKLGNVQVTLEILKALIEKSPRDLPLYAASVLTVLDTILHKNDLTMVEYSIPTFDAFCAHHDAASLDADQEYIKHFEDIVKSYVSYTLKAPSTSKGPDPSASVALRSRKAGLQAISCIASSEALSSEAGRQLKIILPAILENLYSDTADHLVYLQQRAHLREVSETEARPRRKMSIALSRSETLDMDAEPVSKTTADADKLAEEHISLLALQCLKKIFISDSRGQIRAATTIMLEFIENKVEGRVGPGKLHGDRRNVSEWGTKLLESAARWAQVQDRFVILVTAIEALIRLPLTDDHMDKQLSLVNAIGWLLSSNVNLIGLSVMDVLVGLVNHILRLLSLGGGSAETISAAGSRQASRSGSRTDVDRVPIESGPSWQRRDLLHRLQKCIGDLATHIYYSDQISDMISAILMRLKPSPMSSIGSTASAIQDPEATANVISQSANLQEKPHAHEFFSFATARITALKAIKEILVTANMRSSGSRSGVVGRNKVRVQVWEGTQWLLRDVEGKVRKAYVDALLTWLHHEVVRGDLRALDDMVPQPRQSNRGASEGGNLARRAISNASHRDKSPRRNKSTFLQLLHLAIYENAIQYSESECDILLLHLLMSTLVERLGVNAVKSSLPMIVRLQEDIQELESPTSKAQVGSLVHGYFWILAQKFDFEASSAGREIEAEISRRESRGLWVEQIRVPPIRIEAIPIPDTERPTAHLNSQVFETESLRPFDSRAAVVDRIATAYTLSLSSPPSSPPGSPERSFTLPSFGGSKSPTARPELPEGNELPAKTREQMLSDWSKESLIASVEKDSAKTASLNGSRTGTNSGGARNLLAPNGYGGGSGSQTPQMQGPYQTSRPPSASAYGLVSGPAMAMVMGPKGRKDSNPDGSPTPISDSSRGSLVRVDELKRVLSGNAGPRIESLRMEDGSSESMVSAGDISDGSLDGQGREARDFAPAHDTHNTGGNSRERLGTGSSRTEKNFMEHAFEDEDAKDVPPVPPLPPALNLPGGFPGEGGAMTPPLLGSAGSYNGDARTATSYSTQRSGTRKGKARAADRGPWSGGKAANFGDLLGAIDVREDHRTLGVGKPPY